MKKIFLLFLFTLSLNISAQKDSLQLGDKYLEDQLYLGISYIQLFSQPDNVIGSGFSYGFNSGYIKDISLVKSGRLALGIGIGYAYDYSLTNLSEFNSGSHEIILLWDIDFFKTGEGYDRSPRFF